MEQFTQKRELAPHELEIDVMTRVYYAMKLLGPDAQKRVIEHVMGMLEKLPE